MSEPGILFVDDDVELTTSVQNLLSNEFLIYTENDPEKALKIIDDFDIGLVISDYFMEGISGIELLAQILKMKPLIRRILISGDMDVNIVMKSISVSKIHKLLVKPIKLDELRTEINTQLRIYNLKMNYQDQVDGLKQHIKRPHELFELQTNELLSNFKPIWKNKDISKYSARLIIGVNTIVKFSKMLMEIYVEDPNKYVKGLGYIKQNLEDLAVIADRYKQFNLQLYAQILRIYYYLLSSQFQEAKNDYTEYLILLESNYSIFENLLDELNKPSFSIMGENIEDDIELTANIIDDLRKEMIKLLEFDISSHINLNVNFLNYNHLSSIKFNCIIILKTDLVVFLKNNLSTIDSIDLYSSVNILQNLSSELLNKSQTMQTVHFKGGIILIQTYKALKYILVVSENTLESRVKLRKFVHETIEIIKSIPIISIPNLSDVKHINKLAKDIFAI